MLHAKRHDVVRNNQSSECAGRRMHQEDRFSLHERVAHRVVPAVALQYDRSSWARHAAAANGFGGDLEKVAFPEPAASDMPQVVRGKRASWVGGGIAWATRVLVLVRAAAARMARWRMASASTASLSALDDHTLRDLGFHRSEIHSIAAEIAGTAERTRTRNP
jgi:uncharacterized protein YjiS (DUF1127 family)